MASGAAGGGGAGIPLTQQDNPFLIGQTSVPPNVFRRHGNAEQGYGGNMGLTPPGTPPRSRHQSPRGSPRSGTRRSRQDQEDDDEPAARRERTDRSRDREARSETPSEANTSMPTEWGARTLKI